MAKLVMPPNKFTPPEWNRSNQSKYANAEGERISAERLKEESERLIEETEKKTFKTQRDVNKKFGEYNVLSLFSIYLSIYLFLYPCIITLSY